MWGTSLDKLGLGAGMESGFWGFYLDAVGTDETVGPPREWKS